MSDDATKQRGESGTSIPRWARDLGDGVWERINELLNDGFDAPDVIRELKLPESKLRSLQIHARKFGPRRRLIAFSTFKDALLNAAVDNREKFTRALGAICGHAVSTEIGEKKQQNAFALMIDFTNALRRLAAQDALVEQPAQEVKVEVTDKRQKLSEEAIGAIRNLYGIRDDASNGTA